MSEETRFRLNYTIPAEAIQQLNLSPMVVQHIADHQPAAGLGVEDAAWHWLHHLTAALVEIEKHTATIAKLEAELARARKQAK